MRCYKVRCKATSFSLGLSFCLLIGFDWFLATKLGFLILLFMLIFNEKLASNPKLYLQLENFTFLSKLYFSFHQSQESFIYFPFYRIKTLLNSFVSKYGIYFTLVDLLGHLAFGLVSLRSPWVK